MKRLANFSSFANQATRLVGPAVLVFTLCAGLLSPALAPTPARAQGGETDRRLTVGNVVTGTLDAETFMQVYSFSASQGDTISVEVTTEEDTLALVLLLTDEDGSPVAQDADTATPGFAGLSDLTIPTNGTYYITVLRGSGAEGDAAGTFTLRLSGIQQVGGQSVTLENGGLVFDLTWNAAVNLNLEVRDPVGGTVHAFSPGSPSGGTLDADINGNCANAIANEPTETIAWPLGNIPAGSYEVIIYYLDACSVGGPQVFTLSASANGEAEQSLSGTLNPSQKYLARLVLEPNGDWELQNGGVNAGLDVALFGPQVTAATPIALGSTIVGTLTNATPALAYNFEATAGTTVNISLQAQSGSLDTYLALLGPDRTVLASNDDFSDQTTDSAISRSLTVDGTYTIIATRYGLTIGGTEGEYLLTLSTEPLAADTGTVALATPTTGETLATAELPQGAIEITLTWLTNADLQLLVRDPSGASIFDDSPQVQSGGILAEDGNVNCTDTTTSPVSYIYWPPNRLSPGTYEVEVWYQNSCQDTTPVNFALTVDVLDQTIINTTQPTSLNARYLITFKIAQDGTATAGAGGFFDMANANTLNYQSALLSATPITYGDAVTGSISDQQRFVLYSFEGQQGDIVTIAMNASSGSLDPALYLISPEGIQVDYNDDVTPGENSNSVIEAVTLASTGTYTIIATHYGLNLGGTTGTFTLDLRQR